MKTLLNTCAVLILACNAQAATFTVSKPDDTFDGICDADCSLREAIHAANSLPGKDVVALGDMIYLISIPTTTRPVGEDEDLDPEVDEDANQVGDLDITDDLHLVGQGMHKTIIDADYIYRVLEVLPGARVKLQDLEIRRGWVPEAGGGLYNAGKLTLLRVRLADNRSQSRYYFGQGGAIYNEGELRLRRSQIVGNLANGGDSSNGRGGGIYNTGWLLLNKTWVADNTSRDDGDTGGGGGLYNLGTARVEQSLFSGNFADYHGHGGAISNVDGAMLTLENTTLSGNRTGSDGGGALANGERLRQGSKAPGEIHLTNVTIADNEGGGLFNAGRATWINTIIAGNYGGPEPRDYHAGNNCENYGDSFQTGQVSILLGDDGNCVGDIVIDNASVLAFALYPLQNNGGATQTHALRPGPYAIDTSVASCPRRDQRGRPRPADGDGNGSATCDIGAFERQPRDPQ
jgi:CSLREA domain-containing protein